MRIADIRPVWERGAGWWDARSAREQMLLGALAALVLVALLIVAVARPLAAVRAQAAADIRTFDMLSLRLRGAQPASAALRRGPPASLVAQSAAAAGIAVQRIEPQGARLDVVLADAPFDNVVRFVADLEGSSGLRVSEARIERGTAGTGQISAQFLLAGA